MVTKDYEGKLLWLETGSPEKNGLSHIIEKHLSQLQEAGLQITEEEIPKYIRNLLQQVPAEIIYNPKKGFGYVYEIDGKPYIIGVGDNGYIKSFYPRKHQ